VPVGQSAQGTVRRAIVVGSGPNGLAAAVTLARAGIEVEVREQAPGLGGGTRSEELTLPGFVHDVCSAVHPFAAVSPFFRSLPLDRHGLEWVHPAAPLAHPLDDGTAVTLERSVDATAAGLGGDGPAYRELMAPLAERWELLEPLLLGPLVRPPRHPLAASRFGLKALRSARGLSHRVFAEERARALFAGLSAHAIVPLEHAASAAAGLALALAAHVAGWPIPRGGAQRIADALAGVLRAEGGEVLVDSRVESLEELGERLVLCDIGPRGLLELAGAQLTRPLYRRRLERWHYGPAAFKLDWALEAPIPWTADACRRAGTVHLGGTFEEISRSERAAWEGRHSDRPFVLLAQPSLFDDTRAPAGRHTAWAYCHVPNGSSKDMTEAIEAQVERFAPGFRSLIAARSVLTPADLERRNPNLVGGDIACGAMNLRQLVARPALRFNPYSVPLPGVYLCSASTPPGPGVHGMCGYLAARAALRELGLRSRPQA
jgi:phytoene dehydrogenase-like protein